MPSVYSVPRRSLIIAAIAASFAALLGNFALAQKAPIKIVAFGDSLTAGYGLPAGSAFPDVLEKALRAAGETGVSIDNAGVSGDTSTDGLARLDWSVPDGVDAVILELGANDMLRGVDPSITRDALDKILANLTSRHIHVLLAGMLAAPGLGDPYRRQFDAIYPDLAKKYGAILYPFFLDGIAGDRSLLLGDGMHPNRTGVDRVVAAILPTVRALVAQVRKAG